MRCEVDVGVVGAGLAGCLVAGELARLGYRVALASTPPPGNRERLVESISPAARLQLQSRSIGGDVMAAASFSAEWGHGRRSPPEASITLVDLAKLKPELLEWAQTGGVRLASARGFWRARRNGSWQVESGDAGAPAIRARFLVGATGRRGLLPSARTRDPAATVALVGAWGAGRIGDSPPAARIHAFADGWSWSAAWPGLGVTTMAFVAARDLRLNDREGRDRLLRRGLSSLPIRVDVESVEAVSTCDARPFLDHEPVGEDWIKVGDSAASLDPLSGQGNQAAIRSALHSVAAVNTLLHDPGAHERVSRFLVEQAGHAAAVHRRLGRDLYAEALESWPDSPFWRDRSQGPRSSAPAAAPDRRAGVPKGATLKLSPLVRFVTTPCCLGNFIRDCEAVSHPGLTQPLAFLDDIHVPPLLRRIGRSAEASDLLEDWSASQGVARSVRLAQWLIDRRIVMVT